MDQELKKNYDGEQKPNNSNVIERFFDKLFFAMNRDIKITFLVLSVLLNVYTMTKYINSLETRMEDSDQFRDRMIEEIRGQMTPIIQRSVDDKTEEIERKVEDANENLLYLQKTIENAIDKL